jgi:hypothetical protein
MRSGPCALRALAAAVAGAMAAQRAHRAETIEDGNAARGSSCTRCAALQAATVPHGTNGECKWLRSRVRVL